MHRRPSRIAHRAAAGLPRLGALTIGVPGARDTTAGSRGVCDAARARPARRGVLLLVFSAAMLGLAGCGSDGGDGAGSGTTGPATDTSPITADNGTSTTDRAPGDVDPSELPDVGGEGQMASEGTGADGKPAIVVTSPSPMDVVTGSFLLEGNADVYEATVSYTLEDDRGVGQEGFVTATCGSGCRGTFRKRVRLTVDPGYYTLHVFQESAEDGSRQNVVQVPLTVHAAGES